MPSLRRLSAERNNLKEVDVSLCKKANLSSIDLSHNNLTLNKCTETLTWFCRLNTALMSPDFYHCENLKSLKLSNNNITKFPLMYMTLHPWHPLKTIYLDLSYTSISELNVMLKSIKLILFFYYDTDKSLISDFCCTTLHRKRDHDYERESFDCN